MGVDAEGCPGVLVLEVVEGLEGEGVQVGGVSGWGVVGGDEGGEGGWWWGCGGFHGGMEVRVWF